MKRRSSSLPLFSYFLSRIMLKWKQKEGKEKVKPVELSLDSYRHISPAFCIPPVNAISSQTHSPLSPFSLTHILSPSLCVAVAFAEWRTVWLSDVSLRASPPQPRPGLIDVRQQKSWHLLCRCRLHSRNSSEKLPILPSLSHSLTPLLVPAKTLTEISHRVQRRHQVKLKID